MGNDMNNEQSPPADFPHAALTRGAAVFHQENAASYAGDNRAIDLDKSAIIIESLKSRFVEVAETMSDDLWGALETINNDPRHAISQIHHIAHSLAGNAETFGFPVLGRAAYDLSEVIVVQERVANDNMNVREIAELSNHLLEMLRNVAATVRH